MKDFMKSLSVLFIFFGICVFGIIRNSSPINHPTKYTKTEKVEITQIVSRVEPKPIEEPQPTTKPIYNTSKRDIECLAKNIYHEARGSGLKEQIAVGFVTKNRLETGKWGNSYCKVVYSPYQFSWTLKRSHINDWKSYKIAYDIAYKIYTGKILLDFSNGATHYYAFKKIKAPNWVQKGYDFVVLRDHIYMKLPT
jgi:hypothetical protein